MYHLVSKEGNAHTYTENKQKRDRLVREGYRNITAEEEAKAEAKAEEEAKAKAEEEAKAKAAEEAAAKAAKEAAKAEKDAKASGGAAK